MKRSKNIMFSIQKGGVAKTTTTAIMAHLFAKEGGKVLLIDFDPQANLSELVLNVDSNEHVSKSILEALYNNNAAKYIVNVKQNIDIIPSNNFLSAFEKLVYTQKTYDNRKINFDTDSMYLLLDNLLDQVKYGYDYILIDTPPSLGSHMLNALCASDYVIALFHPSRFSYSALPNFLDAVNEANKVSKRNLELAGILPTMCDQRRLDIRTYLELLSEDEDYKGLVFENSVPFRANQARMGTYGIVDNPEITELESVYEKIFKELKGKIHE